ncbi:MAG TPA: hypothetical protein VHV31_08405 [Nitrolancea sp.]|nr:hypothetical protein [Nitrolancea sp.]
MTLDDEAALRIAEAAVDQVGGARYVHGNPRHPFARDATREVEVEGHRVTIRFSEASSPAVVEVGEYVFDIRPDGLIKLFGPS